MTRIETKDMLLRIQVYYQEFKVDDRVLDEWYKQLQAYDLNDVSEKLEIHLKSENYGNFPPKVFNLIRGLKTIDEKEKTPQDYEVRCDLCGKWTWLSKYQEHHDKCLAIKSLQRVLKEDNGEDVSYEEIAQYDLSTIERTFMKYRPLSDNLSNLLNRIGEN